MTAATATGIKAGLILEIGDVDPSTGGTPAPGDGLLEGAVDGLWDRWAARDLVAAGLRELYVRRSCLELVLAVLIPRLVDVQDNTAGLGIKGSQVVAGYERKLARTQAEIDRIETIAARVGASAIQLGKLAHRSPVEPRIGPNPSNRRYGGTVGRRRRVLP